MERPKSRADFSRDIASLFIKLLSEKGEKWKKEWKSFTDPPRNAVSGREYTSSNMMMLSLICRERGYTDPRFATMNQITDRRGIYHGGKEWRLKKGAKAAYAECFLPFDRNEKKFLEKGGTYEGSDIIFIPRYYALFNADEIEGIEPYIQKDGKRISLDSFAEMLSVSLSVPVFEDGGDAAYYDINEDSVHVPERCRFNSSYSFNSTLLHELVHATGHRERLGRFEREDHSYAAEELTAELASCFLGKHLSEDALFSEIRNHGAYISSWMKMIENEPRLLTRAAEDAADAASYITDVMEKNRERFHDSATPDRLFSDMQIS